MARLECEALVLRVVDFGESDRIAHLLTPARSRLTVIAKGARRSRRRFPGTLDLFNRLAVQVERRRPQAMGRLEQARLLDAFPALRRDPARFALACYVAELVDRLAPEGAGGREGRRLYDTTLEALRATAARPADARLRVLLELRLLGALGLAPELRRCVRCGRELVAAGRGAAGPAASGARAAAGAGRPAARGAPDPGPAHSAGFHVAEGGPLCRACARPADALVPIHLGTLRALEQGLQLPLEHAGRLGFGAEAQREALALLDRFQRFHAGIELRSARFLARVVGS